MRHNAHAWALLALGLSAVPVYPTTVAAAPDRRDSAEQRGAPSVGVLPLRSVRLYEAGVGYFERSGPLSQGATSLPVPAGHIDDALKSLVILQKPGSPAVVSGVTFPTRVSKGMGRALAGLPQGDDPISHHALLAALRGAAVEVRTPQGAITGRLIEVLDLPAEVLPAPGEQAAPKADAKAGERSPTGHPMVIESGGQGLLVLTDRGELRRLRPREVLGVRPVDPAYAARLGAALDAPDSKNPRGAQVLSSLRLAARAGGPVTLGYVAEAPLFRVSYRLVFGESGNDGALQAWALLHNDADEDWREVRVHLVSGRPDSFLFPLAAPRYARRPLLHPERPLSTVPQLLGTTADTLWGDNVDESSESAMGMGGIGTVGHGSGGGGVGYGYGSGRVGSSESESGLLAVGNLAGLAQAQGVESGALFAYTLATPLTLPAHSSALVPVLQQTLPAEAITWFSEEGEPARSAVRLRNQSPQTLPEGPLAVFAAGGFAGEAILPRMKPGEQRFLTFGSDLDVELTVQKTVRVDEPQRLRRNNEKLEVHFVRRTEKTYELKSRAGAPRAVHLVLKVHHNGDVKGADRLDYDSTASQPVAVFSLAARQRVTKTLKITEGLVRSEPLGSVSTRELTRLSESAGLPAAERAAVTEALARRRALDALQKDEAAKKEDLQRVERDLARWRDNLKALGGGDRGQAGHPFVKRVLELEDRRNALVRAQEELQVELSRRADAVQQALRALPLRDEKDAPTP